MAELFNFFNTEDIEAPEATEEEVQPLPQEYGIDFQTGKLTGAMVEGLEAVKVWAWLALKSPRYRFRQLSWQYGAELENLIGTVYSEEYTEAQARKMVEDCLLLNRYITGITDFVCTAENDRLKLEFTILTEFGEGDMAINV